MHGGRKVQKIVKSKRILENMENTAKASEIHTHMLKNGMVSSTTTDEMRRQVASSPNEATDAASLLGVATNADTTWYALNVSNNNNATAKAVASNTSDGKKLLHLEGGTSPECIRSRSLWNCEQCGAADVAAGGDHYNKDQVIGLGVVMSNLDKCGGGAELAEEHENGEESFAGTPGHHTLYMSAPTECVVGATASNFVLDGAAAASITPPANSSSNRTSVNNSTDNLSYSSDNYYPDELIVLQSTLSADDIEDDEEAEKISLYSDDCVYAYRGDGADYELTLAAMNSRSHFVDDETDFLEMDFEPDPLSEVECSGVGMIGPMDVASSFLMHRDACAMSNVPAAVHAQRQLYNSPIENMLTSAVPIQKGTANNAGLQSQSSLLNKNFARIALHLDKIKSDETPATTAAACNRRDSAGLEALPVETLTEQTEPLAHSLPNSLLATFGRVAQDVNKEMMPTTSPKITGAKPKRLNTFSTSSSTSSKNSSKSRNSIRSSFVIAAAGGGLCSSNSFDERSVSCTDFRCNPADELPSTSSAAAASGSNATCIAALNDETCLDCLEKEFLANTIGKAMDLSECPKCRKRRSINTLYAAHESRGCCNSTPHQLKSTSLCYEFHELPSDCVYTTAGVASAAKSDFMQQFHRNESPRERNLHIKLNERGGASVVQAVDKMLVLGSGSGGGAGVVASSVNAPNQRSTCDIFVGKHLLKSVMTEKEIITISTHNLDEETLVLALDKLHVAYNAELIKWHFNPDNHQTFVAAHKSSKQFKSMKHFILHASRQQGNHPRLKRLIEMATRGHVEVVFKKDPLITKTEMLPIKVGAVLHQWAHTNDLEALKQLDKRFQDANVLGKIANIIRQAQQRCSPRRPLPEFISIPQYYTSGYLTLTKKG